MATANQISNPDLGVIGARFTQLIEYLAGVRKMSALAQKEIGKEQLLEAIIRILFEHLAAEDVSLYLLENDVLNCVANLNWEKFIENSDALGTRSQSYKLGENLAGQSALEKKVLHINDCTLQKDSRAVKNAYAAGSVIYAPIMHGDKVIGIIELYHPYSNHFNHWQEYSVSIYADLVAMLLDYNALLYDMQGQIDQRTEELQKALKESERLRRRYEEMSIIDHLTKLYNRRFFFNEVTSGLSRALRYDQSFSLLIMDLDHFKEINDTYGHDCGDDVLKNIANILSRFTREGDTLARYGGEEFVMALPNTNLDGAMKLAERIRSTIEATQQECKEHSITLTISIGVTSMQQESVADDEIVNYHPQVADLIR